MRSLATQPPEERALYWRKYSELKNVPEFVVEKDFWVCWLLGRIYATSALDADCILKGGTTLSKVFGVINRFSEDIDLALTPASLGWLESDLDNAPSTSQREKRAKKLEADCAEAVRTRFLRELESIVASSLGPRPAGGGWLSFVVDAATKSPVILFPYPQAVPSGSYIPPQVKVEFGSLTDQRPTGTHPITPFVAEIAPGAFGDFGADVVALEMERTFWEKATILHAEHHRPPAQRMRDRFARHYSDLAALWQDPRGRAAASRLDMLERVRLHKSRFFASSWARYEQALPGTLRLVPPEARIAELRRDYAAMGPMFLSPPPSFEKILDILSEAEHTINSR